MTGYELTQVLSRAASINRDQAEQFQRAIDALPEVEQIAPQTALDFLKNISYA